MHPFTAGLINHLASLADKEKAVGMKAYMKNQLEFLGINMPARRAALKHYLKNYKDDYSLGKITRELWELPEREYQYCAIEILAYNKKYWQENLIDVVEYGITTKSWWDTVDFIATEILGPYFKIYPNTIDSITKSWNKSENIWLQRSSLLFQKSYKKETNVELLASYISNLSISKEFFVQKAIGWILREYAKTNSEWVKAFVMQHTLAPLSKREALKHLK
jgi:3-methyladenine DNA glycosylase AlkD